MAWTAAGHRPPLRQAPLTLPVLGDQVAPTGSGPSGTAIYASAASHGFLIRDEDETADAKQVYFSREKRESPPTLVVSFRAP
jgi:hypothetical protein